MHFGDHKVQVVRGDLVIGEVPMDAGLTAEELLDRLVIHLAPVDLGDEVDRGRLRSESEGSYDESAATAFWSALSAVATALEDERAKRSGDTSPVQLWPHGFDASFEWFGTKMVEHTEGSTTEMLPGQLNLGWYPAGDAYFYSNPWPFDEGLTAVSLPGNAEWHTEGWMGSTLAYSTVSSHDAGISAFVEFATAVFEAAAPTLTA